MRKITLDFDVYTNFGKGDSVDWELSYEVTEEDYQRLVEAAKEYDEFEEAEDIKDLYEKVYEAAVLQATQDMIENDPESVEDYLEGGESLESWRADFVCNIGVNFPYEILDVCEND